MKNLIFEYEGGEYIDSGVYEITLKEEALKQGVEIDEDVLDELMEDLESNGNVEDYRNATSEDILDDYLNSLI
jgi:hypothetical protein